MQGTCPGSAPIESDLGRGGWRWPRAALLLASLAGCLGNYQFGARTLFPEGIETVYVPVFDSSSYRRELGEELTEAVIKEIEHRSYYKVVSSPSADTVLTGTITGETKHLLFETLTGDPREDGSELAGEGQLGRSTRLPGPRDPARARSQCGRGHQRRQRAWWPRSASRSPRATSGPFSAWRSRLSR